MRIRIQIPELHILKEKNCILQKAPVPRKGDSGERVWCCPPQL